MQRVAVAVAVLGVLDQVGLGLLEALGLAAARLVDRAHLGIEVVFVAGDAADPAGVGGGGRLFLADEVVSGVFSAMVVSLPQRLG